MILSVSRYSRWPRQVHSLFIAGYESAAVANVFAKNFANVHEP
jgi:hypothetical protein